jgi:putative toxin-antitoxin system antitoxin component (TIGR02293 family)
MTDHQISPATPAKGRAKSRTKKLATASVAGLTVAADSAPAGRKRYARIEPAQARKAAEPAAALGWLKSKPQPWVGLAAHDVVIDGLPVQALGSFVESFALLPKAAVLAAIGVHERTYQRIRKDQTRARLDSKVTDGIFKLDEVRKLALEVLGSEAAAEAWLSDEAIGLENRRPIDLVRSTPGAALVKQLLQRMQYGVYA